MCAPCMDCRAKAKKYILVAGAYLVGIDISLETHSEGQHINNDCCRVKKQKTIFEGWEENVE